MVALMVGIVFIAFAIFACVPGPLAWWSAVIAFLKGSLPVIALLVGLIAVFIGIADIKDHIEAKKEEAEEAAEAAHKDADPKDAAKESGKKA
jgi:flagellar biosynthesis/type III secretory pathway M-ring protein FliF/YscJ